jgi:2-dehydropantoate 2-reductase
MGLPDDLSSERAASERRALIVGAGAVGCFVGARLALGGVAVTLVGRGPVVEATRTAGLRLREPEGERETGRLSAFTSLAEAFTACEYDLALLTVKAYDTEPLIAEMLAAANMLPPVMSLQNGVGNEELLADAFGPTRVVAGALETPLSMPSPGVIAVHRSRYRAGVAPVGSRPLAGLAGELLRRGGLIVDAYDDHRQLKWSKLLLNLPANAMCAILDWTPARCIGHPLTAPLEARAWQEAFRVMEAMRLRPVNLAGYPLSLLAPIVPRLPAGLLARGMARTVAGGRGGKMPSLQVALSAGKRSEVPWLNGAVARAGLTAGVPTPVNDALARILSAISLAPETWHDWQGQPQRLASHIDRERNSPCNSKMR